jgi:D-xylose 1-dehydrogenase (NADP+, D-xylono-1,5-lactone-forming)
MTGSGAPLRWGILSTARINDEVIPQLGASPEAELVAVASRDPARAQAYARERGIPVGYGSYSELLADAEIDCVYISVPNQGHVPLSAQALRAGKHVLCEKPLAVSAEEAAWLFEVARASDRLVMEAVMYRHHDKTRRLVELVREGSLGEINVIRAWFHFRAEDPTRDIRFLPELASGSLRDVGCYCTSILLLLIGEEPVSVVGEARLAPTGVDEAFVGVMRFSSGALGVFDCSMVADLNVGVTVLGTQGRAEIEMPWYAHLAPHHLRIERADGSEEIPTSRDNAYRLEIENFCAAVRGQAEQTITPEETMRNLGVMDRLAEAANLEHYVNATTGAAIK